MLAFYQGNLTQARAYLDQSIRKSQELDTGQSKWMKCVLANVYLKEENIVRAQALVEEYETFIKETRFINRDAAYITLSRGNIYLAKSEFFRRKSPFNTAWQIFGTKN